MDSRFERLRWTMFFILMLSYMLVFFHRIAAGAVAEEMMRTFGATGAELGVIASLYFWVYTLMQVPAGVLVDRQGLRGTIAVGSLVAGLGSLLFGVAPSVGWAMAGRALVGAGVSVVFVGVMKFNAVWFHTRMYGVMSGITILMGNVGAVAAAGPLAWLVTVMSWRIVFAVIGAVSVVVAVLVWIKVRNRPQDKGYEALNEYGVTIAPHDRNLKQEILSVVRARGIIYNILVNGGIGGCLFAFFGLWGMPFLRDAHGMTRAEAGSLMTVMTVAFAIGFFLSGWLSDRMQKRKPVVMYGTIVNACLWLVVLYVPYEAGTFATLLYAVFGLTGSLYLPSFACARELCPPQIAGMAIAVVNAGTFLTTAVLQPLTGMILDARWDGTMVDSARHYTVTDWKIAMSGMLFFVVLGLAGALRMRESHCRNVSAES